LPAGGHGDQPRMIQGMDQFPQPGTRRLPCRVRNSRAADWSAASRGRTSTAPT
jgi:hypothetical protein